MPTELNSDDILEIFLWFRRGVEALERIADALENDADEAIPAVEGDNG